MRTRRRSRRRRSRFAELPPNTLKADIRPVFQPFGEVKCIFVRPGGRHAHVVFADVKSDRRAYAEQTLCMRGREILVFLPKNHVRSAGSGVGKGSGSSFASKRPYYVRHEQDDGVGGSDGALFVVNFSAGTTQEEPVEVFAPYGKYEQFVTRTYFSTLSFSSRTDVVPAPVCKHMLTRCSSPSSLPHLTLRISRPFSKISQS
jgi:hypothetical protein